MEVNFGDANVWDGPFFELYIEAGDHPESSDLGRMMSALWESSDLEGPYDRYSDQAMARKLAIPPQSMSVLSHTFGMAKLPDGNRVPCGIVIHTSDSSIDPRQLPEAIRQRLRDESVDSANAITFYVPFPALDILYEVDWESWTLETQAERMLRKWLGHLASDVYERVPFEFAVIAVEGTYDQNSVRTRREPTPPGVTVLRPDAGRGHLRITL